MNDVARRIHRDALQVRIARLDDLAWTSEGPTRGHAHIDTPELSIGAPGRLDFAPLLLVGNGLVHPGEGFAMHRHAGIENVLVMLAGRMAHEDSLGNACVLGKGDVALLSAGAGAEHAERALGSEDVRALVIWIRSARPDAPPAFAWRHAPRARGWAVLAGPRGDAALSLRADAEIRSIALAPGASCGHDVRAGRRVYAIAIGGPLDVDGVRVGDGERVLAEGVGTLCLRAHDRSQIVLVDMAAG